MFMRGRSHGKHCQTRSFRTVCPNLECGVDVFYWECLHGCKIFFEYPVYGKLIRHRCKKRSVEAGLKKKHLIEVKVPTFEDLKFYDCPICGKIFKNKDQLVNHIRELKKNDSAHQSAPKNLKNLNFQQDFLNFVSKKAKKDQYEPLFGKISIIKKKQK